MPRCWRGRLIAVAPTSRASDAGLARDSRRGRPLPCSTTGSCRLCRCSCLQNSLHTLGREWYATETDTGGGEDRVGDDGRDGAGCRLARAHRRLVATVDQHDLDGLRHLAEAQERIGLPVQAGDASSIEADLFFQGAAQRLNNVALDL